MRLVLLLIPALAIAGEFTTSLGDRYPYNISSIATDTAGNTYIVGVRAIQSANLTSNGVLYPAADVFVAKLDPTGKLLFSNTFAGNGVDIGSAITLDPSGNIYIAGTTTSNNFPLSHALQTQANTAGTGFIMKLSNDGTTILYSTYFGGTLGKSAITALATDSKGNLYLTGYTQATDFPHTAGMPFGNITQTPASPSPGVILASISAAGDKILYSGAIVGATPCTLPNILCSSSSITSEGVGVGVDGAGNAYVAGNYLSFNLPTTAGVLSPGGIGAFVAKVNPGGGGLGYLTYIGSGFIGSSQIAATALNKVIAVAVDAAGNAYLAGSTQDPNFPSTATSYQPSGQGGFVAKLRPDGSAMAWATYFDGTSPQSIGLDSTGNVWVTGTTGSSPLPNANGWTSGPEFLASLDGTGSRLTYSALFPSGSVAQSVAVDQSGLVHAAGFAGFLSAVVPGGAPAARIFAFGNGAGGPLTARVSPGEVVAIYGPSIGPAAALTAAPANGYYPTTLSGVQVTVNGVNAPLLYVSANQINAVVPMGLTSNSPTTVRIVNGTSLIPDFPLRIIFSSPRAFAPVLNADGTINSQLNPAAAGSFVSYYATGWQSSFAPLIDGQVAIVAQDACRGNCRAGAESIAAPFTTPYILPATMLYAGAAPGIIAGVTQFNVQFGTTSAPSGAYEFVVSASIPGMNAANETVWVKLP